MYDDQGEFQERFEWGEAGVRRLAATADVLVVVDVLSFGTTVDVAVGRGATIFPYRWRDARAASFANDVGAVLAGGREDDVSEIPYSLSPTSLLSIASGTRLVLPSPNGTTLVLLAAGLGSIMLVGCLRNAALVATACRDLGETVALIAAGERWADAGDQSGTLRPAVEDLVGAGAILSALEPTRPSPEAIAAMAAFRAAASDLGPFLERCASGRELRERGFASDVELAAQLDVSSGGRPGRREGTSRLPYGNSVQPLKCIVIAPVAGFRRLPKMSPGTSVWGAANGEIQVVNSYQGFATPQASQRESRTSRAVSSGLPGRRRRASARSGAPRCPCSGWLRADGLGR